MKLDKDKIHIKTIELNATLSLTGFYLKSFGVLNIPFKFSYFEY